MKKSMNKMNAGIFIFMISLITTNAMAQLGSISQRGTEGRGGSIMQPLQPQAAFSYDCSLKWIYDTRGGTHMSEARFKLNNQAYSSNQQDFVWKHGYADSLNLRSPMSRNRVGTGEALKQGVVPYTVYMYFDYSDAEDLILTEQSAYKATLNMSFGVTKGTSHTTSTLTVRGLMTDSSLELEGKTSSNGEGENQNPFLYRVSCIREKP